MKSLKFLLGGAGVLAFLALAACTTDEPDEAYSAKTATVTSTDPSFVADETGGAVSFATGGNTVVISVACDVDWEAVNDSPDWLEANVSVSAGTLTLVAGQNTDAKEQTATVILQTSASGVKFATINVTQTAYNASELSLETNTWHAPAVGALSTVIAVTSSSGWTVENDCEWLTVEQTSGGVSVTAAENEETEERAGEFSVTCTDGISSASATVAVTQDGRAYVTLGSESLTLDVDGGSATVAVESNFDWNYSYDTSNGWFTVTAADGGLTVTASANESEGSREGTVTVTAGDGAENVAEASFTLIQADQSSKSMILVYDLTSITKATTIKLPAYGTVDCTVDWGDGSEPESFTSNNPSHSYEEAGTYEVTISGTVTELYSFSITSSTKYISEVKQWGKTGLTSMYYAFYGGSALTTLPEETGDAFAEVESFKGAFYNCKTLKTLPKGIFDKCSKVTTFTNCFFTCSALDGIPEGLLDNCTAAEQFDYMFKNCESIPSIPAGLFDNCPNATTFNQVFYACSGIESVPAHLFDKNPLVTSFGYVFYGLSKITSLPDGIFDNCPLVTAFEYGLYGCSSLKSLPKGIFDKFTEVTTFANAFYNCESLESLEDGIFDNCTKVTTFSNAFRGCKSLKAIPAGLFDKNTECTNYTSVFYGCSSVTKIPDGLFKGKSGVTTYSSAFRECTGITSIPADLFEGCSTSDVNCTYIFNGCTGLESVPEGLFDGFTGVTSFGYCFTNCTSLKTVPASLFSKCPLVKTFTQTFNGCSALECESPYDELTVDGQTVHVHLYNRLDDAYSSNYGVTKITSTSCFTGCEKLTDYNDIPSGWK